MNFIPETAVENGNYLCTWDLQEHVARKLGLRGQGCSEQRDALDEKTLFGDLSLYHIYPAQFRPGLYLLLDDGWDVPYGTAKLPKTGIEVFGSVEPDAEKFASFGKTPEERLTNLSRRVRELGYAGLGLWIAPQRTLDESENPDFVRDRAYWEEKAAMCRRAGIRYWKVDWGRRCDTAGYREMMTECVRKCAPGLYIEHAVPTQPYERVEAGSEKAAAMRDRLAVSDFFRTYDVAKPFDDIATLNRLDVLLSGLDGITPAPGSLGNVNVEVCAYIGAALGFHLGIMYHDTETEAALRWQRLSPPFSAFSGKYHRSETALTDSYYFDSDPLWWLPAAKQTATFSTPAVMTRNTPLPTVDSNGAPAAHILASLNPATGAYAIASVCRVIDPNPRIIAADRVTAYPAEPTAPVGVFGYFERLTLTYPQPLPAGIRVFAQCLAGGDATDITGEVQIDGSSISLDGKTLRDYGKNTHDYHETYTPSLLLMLR